MNRSEKRIGETNRIYAGLVISEDCESVMLAAYDKNDQLEPIAVGKCEIGIAIGDMIEFDFSIISEFLNDIRTAMEAKEDSNKLIRLIYMHMYTVCSYNSNDVFETNLYVMPLYAEMINMVLDYRSGKKPNYRDVEQKIDFYKKKTENFRYLCERILTPSLKKDPLAFYLDDDNVNRPSSTYSGKTIIYDLKFENYQKICEYFFPETLDDFFGYCVCKTLTTRKRFIKCHYCGRYFAYTTNGKTKYCSRMVADKGFPCNEIGRSLRYTADINASEAKTMYRKYYRKVNYHVNAGNLSRDAFEEWAVKARTLRDKTEGGKMALEDFENWLKNNLPV